MVKAPEEPPKEFKTWKTNPPALGDLRHRAPTSLRGWLWRNWSNRQEDNGGDAAQKAGEARLLPEGETVESGDEKMSMALPVWLSE